MKEARFTFAVIRAVRSTINSDAWMKKNHCRTIQEVYKCWINAASESNAGSRASPNFTSPTAPALPAVPDPPAASSGPSNIRRAMATVRASTRASRAVSMSRVDGSKLDLKGLGAALSFTFPEGSALGEQELQMVYRSLDGTRRGHVTLSSFSSTFTIPRREGKTGEPPMFYSQLPTWGDTIGGYIPKNEKEMLLKRNLILQHGKGGVEMPEDARGVASGFGLGHVDNVAESLGWQLRVHGDLDANVLKWGNYAAPPLPPPPPKRKPLPPKPLVPIKPKPKQKPPQPKPPRGPSATEVDQRYRAMQARKVQRRFRAHLAQRRAREAEQKAAATRLQARARARQTSKAYRAAKFSSIRVQKAVRALLHRLSAAAALRELRKLHGASATTIQRQYQRWHFRRVISAVRWQRSFRAHLCRRLLKSLQSVRLAEESARLAAEQERQAKEWARRAQEEAAKAAEQGAEAAGEAARLKGLTNR